MERARNTICISLSGPKSKHMLLVRRDSHVNAMEELNCKFSLLLTSDFLSKLRKLRQPTPSTSVFTHVCSLCAGTGVASGRSAKGKIQ